MRLQLGDIDLLGGDLPILIGVKRLENLDDLELVPVLDNFIRVLADPGRGCSVRVTIPLPEVLFLRGFSLLIEVLSDGELRLVPCFRCAPGDRLEILLSRSAVDHTCIDELSIKKHRVFGLSTQELLLSLVKV